MGILDLDYIKRPMAAGDTCADALDLLRANGRGHTAAHCLRVAETCATLATRFHADTKTAYASGILHDVSAVIRPADMLVYAEENGWPIDPSERKHPFILHQRVSVVIAEEHFHVRDERILSAIACHSTLKPDPSAYDMILFLADKIAWDQEGTPPFLDAVEAALEDSLCRAALAYINYVMENGLLLMPHRWLIEARAWLKG